MPFEVMLVVLLGAALHASWNALVRAAADRIRDLLLIVLGAAAWTLVALPFVPAPAPASWPYLAGSALIHVAYFVLVAQSYRAGELSFVYPLMRGAAPAMAALLVLAAIGEAPSLGGWIGVLLISGGVLLLTGDSWRAGSFRAGAAGFALGNAAVIAIYTLVDGQGARLSGDAFAYTAWMFLATAVLLAAFAGAVHGRDALPPLATSWRRGLLGGACTLASYGLALWAMTRAPIALVAALRETSVVFAAIIAAVFLKERISRLRALSIAIVVAGAAAMKVL